MNIKKILLCFIVTIFISCKIKSNENNSAVPVKEELKIVNKQHKIEDFSVALEFINKYVNNYSSDGWIENNNSLSKKFKDEYIQLITEAEKDDPEYGLGFDPIVDAQDSPDEFVIKEADSITGYTIVRGVKWKTFEVAMKVIKINNTYLVDGCGIINIPKEKQAKR